MREQLLLEMLRPRMREEELSQESHDSAESGDLAVLTLPHGWEWGRRVAVEVQVVVREGLRVISRVLVQLQRVSDVMRSVMTVLRSGRCVGDEGELVRRGRLVVADAEIRRGSGASEVVDGWCCVAAAASARQRAGLVVNPRRSERRYYGHSVGPGARGVQSQGRRLSKGARRLPNEARWRKAEAHPVSVASAAVPARGVRVSACGDALLPRVRSRHREARCVCPGVRCLSARGRSVLAREGRVIIRAFICDVTRSRGISAPDIAKCDVSKR